MAARLRHLSLEEDDFRDEPHICIFVREGSKCPRKSCHSSSLHSAPAASKKHLKDCEDSNSRQGQPENTSSRPTPPEICQSHLADYKTKALLSRRTRGKTTELKLDTQIKVQNVREPPSAKTLQRLSSEMKYGFSPPDKHACQSKSSDLAGRDRSIKSCLETAEAMMVAGILPTKHMDILSEAAASFDLKRIRDILRRHLGASAAVRCTVLDSTTPLMEDGEDKGINQHRILRGIRGRLGA